MTREKQEIFARRISTSLSTDHQGTEKYRKESTSWVSVQVTRKIGASFTKIRKLVCGQMVRRLPLAIRR